MKMVKIENAQVASYELAITIEKPRAAVWKALTAETNNWWLPSFHMMGEGSIVSMRAEAGGGLIEKREGGGSTEWFAIKKVEPNKAIEMMSSKWYAGASMNLFKINLADEGKGTRLTVTDAHIGIVDEKSIGNLEHGWTELFTQGLKKYCEGA
jgi:uncharacterized protein YndB with AHSA1/START domain